MGPSITDIILVALLLLGHSLFALAEIALISSRRARLREMADEGNRGARVALDLTEEPDLFLALIQFGIVSSAVLVGMLGGAGLAPMVSGWLVTWGLSGTLAPTVGFGIVLALLVLLEILVGELVPRRIASRDPEGTAAFLSPLMRLLTTLAAPLLRVINALAAGVTGALGLGAPPPEPSITEEEVNHLIEQGTRAGVFHEAEQEIVARVLRLGDRTIRHLMTPRTDVVWLAAEASLEENLRRMDESGYSNFPVCHRTADNVVGVVSMKDVWRRMLPALPVAGTATGARAAASRPNNAPLRWKELLQEPLLVPEGTTVIRVLEKFRESRRHFAIVVDEYGGLAGVVTDHDILEAVVGEMIQGDDPDDERGVIPRDDGSFLVNGWVSTDDVKRLLQLRELPGEEDEEYHTAAGFLIHLFGRIPQEGEFLEWGGWRLELIDTDGPRIDKILMQPLESPAEEAEAAADDSDSDVAGPTVAESVTDTD